MYNRGTRLLESGRYAKAAAIFRRQLRTNQFKECYLNLGNCYRYLNLDDAALDAYLAAANSNTPFSDGRFGSYPSALNNIGLLEYSRNNLTDAERFYRAALTLDPLYTECIWNLGNCQLKASNSVAGWPMYEYRFNRGPGSVVIDTSIPRWDGISNGTSICVLTEQGIGDKIQFARYLPLLKPYFSDVIINCHASLNCLFPGYTCSETVSGSVSIPLCSLPGIFGVVPVSNYLSGTPHRFGTGRHIGVVASGSPTHANDYNRSVPIYNFARFAAYGKLWGLNPADAKHSTVTPLASTSWQQTIDYVLGLDVVVTVDTSIVHLAGTLGKPCIMMQPSRDTDFRWGLPGVQNPWYNSVYVVDNYNNWEATLTNAERLLALC